MRYRTNAFLLLELIIQVHRKEILSNSFRARMNSFYFFYNFMVMISIFLVIIIYLFWVNQKQCEKKSKPDLLCFFKRNINDHTENHAN